MPRPVSHDPVSRMLRAIADPTRRRILALLKQKGCCSIARPVGLCACDIESRVKLSQPTVSHHMAVLTEAGLVRAEKYEQWMWYRRNERGLDKLRRTLQIEL